MRRTRSAQINNPYSLRWPLVGILLLLVLFGHDALMTTEVKAGQFVVLPGTLTIDDTLDYDTDHVVDERSTSPTPDRHSSHPDTDCGVNANIASLQGSSFSTQVVLPTVVIADLPVPTGSGARVTFEPITPSSVRRALLQIYLI